MFKLKGRSNSFRSPSIDIPRSPSSSRPSSPAPAAKPPPRPSSTPPSFAPKDQFTTQQPRTPPGSLPRSPTSPRSPTAAPGQRPWGVDPKTQQFSQSVVNNNPGAQLTQYVAQGSHPDLHLNGGACNAITKEWIKTGAQNPNLGQASTAFGHKLDNNVQDMHTAQLQHQANVARMKEGNQELRTRLNALEPERARLSALAEKHQRGELTPAESQALAKDSRKLERQYAQLNKVKGQIDQDIVDERASLGGGMKHTPVLQDARIDNESIQKLHGATQQDGFYAIHINKPGDPDGHVMGLQSQGGKYKFMDPNTGEFTMPDHKTSTNVLLDHLDGRYGSFDTISLDHFQ